MHVSQQSEAPRLIIYYSVKTMTSSPRTKVPVHGRPGKRICQARGLWQGDPLSPMLFVIVIEVLNAMIAAHNYD